MMEITVASVERIRVNVPFTPRVRPWNGLLAYNWGHIELIKLTTSTGVVGWGETLLNYTWKLVSDDAVRRVQRKPIMDHLWDDSLGAGLQMALLDAMSRCLEVPAYRLLGLPQARPAVQLAWWSTKMPAEVLGEEAAEAASRGFRAHKFKARPWIDIEEQLDAVTRVTPDDYGVGADWNSLLLTASGAREVLARVDDHPRLHYIEAPVGRAMVADQRTIRSRLTTPLVEHYDAAMYPTWIQQDALDGFVVDTGGISRFIQIGTACAAFNKEFWLQLVGTGLGTALAIQLGAVLTHARWPSVTALNVFESSLVKENLDPVLGFVPVPDTPGLGVTVDEDAVERYRVADDFVVPRPQQLLRFILPNGVTREYASVDHLWKDSLDDGTLGIQPRGARLEVLDDDGTPEFAKRRADAAARFEPTGVPWFALTFYPGMDT
jgi:L-alanine-DL-glutamate epimerase-like enolase superfamily enzyme